VKENVVIHALSHVSLRWMVREIVGAGVKVLFDEKALGDLHIPMSKNTSTMSPQIQDPASHILANRAEGDGFKDQRLSNYDPRDVEDVKDVKTKITDQLVNVPAWRFLEYIPTWFPSIDDKGKPNVIRR
jgi:hypothetical protein